MSDNDNPDLLIKSFFPHEKNLIYLVKKFPITYLTPPPRQLKFKAKWDTAWEEIGKLLCQPSSTCKRRWTNIKWKYAKILILINTGKITKEAAMSHPKTSKFFDGLLSFINPFIVEITDEKIPLHIHKSINNIFGFKTIDGTNTTFGNISIESKESHTQFVTHAQVKALLKQRQSIEEQNLIITEPNYLQNVVDNVVRCKLQELLKKDHLLNPSDHTITNLNVPSASKNLQNVHKRKPHFTSVPNKTILNNDEENTTKTVNLGLATELIIEDDIKCEPEDDNIKKDDDDDDDDDIKEENLTNKILVNNASDETCDVENILPITKIIIPDVHETMTNIISSLSNDVIEDNTEPISDDYIRNFFNELGEVMSLELSINKQKILQSQINDLVKDTLLKENG